MATPPPASAGSAPLLESLLLTEAELLDPDLALEDLDLDELDLLDPNILLESEIAAGVIPPSVEAAEREEQPSVWYLGIDLGTTGISAVLLNRLSGEVYPVYWADRRSSPASGRATEPCFRLPTTVYLTQPSGVEIAPSFGDAAVGAVAIPPLSGTLSLTGRNPDTSVGQRERLLYDFKPYLKIGIPHYSPETSRWEPVLQWSDDQEVSLSVLHQALRTLIATLSSQPVTPASAACLTCGAVGLETATFQSALQQLAAVVVGYPVNWSDTYSFNVREAILSAKLVAHPEQIFFLEDAIAIFLSGLPTAEGRSLQFPQSQPPKPYSENQGTTVVISAGATLTDLAIVDLPDHAQTLRHGDFSLRSLPYAGNAIDQDIICQLLYPAWLGKLSAVLKDISVSNPAAIGQVTALNSIDRFDQHSNDPQASLWDSLGWEQAFPRPGELDVTQRHQLQHRLTHSPFGQQLLEAARHLKLTLQRQERITLQVGDRPVTILRQDLVTRVYLHYIQRLNRELNTLLSQSQTEVQAVKQVICSGGTASLSAIARFLRQKFPKATILQDTYDSPPALFPDNVLAGCSRVAYGLATLPLHPQVLNQARQQYSDYFLLMELLREFPERPTTTDGIMHILERQGINTQACQLHILALLEGHLPPGLVPSDQDAALLTALSQQNPDYQVLRLAPLFYKRDYAQGGSPSQPTYRPNYGQWNHFRRYLSTLLASTHQKLTEPLTKNLTPV